MNLRVGNLARVSRDSLRQHLLAVRDYSKRLSAPLSAEDQGLQSMPDASPTKWHLAHTTWFFEALVLVPHVPNYRPFNTAFFELFNSYYEALGPRHPRPQRGVLSRPSLDDVIAYRRHVDAALLDLVYAADDNLFTTVAPIIELGLHHEQQHQELILTDIKHAFSCNPLRPGYSTATPIQSLAAPLTWHDFAGGLVEVGHSGDEFAFDNECPRHRVWLEPFRLANRPVTCGEYLDFIADGGYTRPEFWLSEGWTWVQTLAEHAPLYWLPRNAQSFTQFTLHGESELDPHAPVCHVSFFEAAAYAAWAGARLPTEFEWELVAHAEPALHRHDLTSLHPQLSRTNAAYPHALFGEVWEWTQSAYSPYPGFTPWSGFAAEYNGKFMVNQLVLRGGSCVTPPGHLRASYRNFFPATARWQFSGIRLAKDLT